MATNRSADFPSDDRALADFAGALAHPARIAIMRLLQDVGEAPCGHIVDKLPLSQASVSQHLQCLSQAGLLKHRQCGKRVCYSIDCERVRNFCHTFQCTLGTMDTVTTAVDETTCCEDGAACRTAV